MKIASLVFTITAVILSITFASAPAIGQDASVAAANLAAAQELSTVSGRPIFAIAGRKT